MDLIAIRISRKHTVVHFTQTDLMGDGRKEQMEHFTAGERHPR